MRNIVMEPKTERILTIAVIIAVIGLMAGIAYVLIAQHNGSIDPESTTAILAFLSTTLTTVVVIFGALTLNTSRSEEYKKYFEEREKEEREKE